MESLLLAAAGALAGLVLARLGRDVLLTYLPAGADAVGAARRQRAPLYARAVGWRRAALRTPAGVPEHEGRRRAGAARRRRRKVRARSLPQGSRRLPGQPVARRRDRRAPVPAIAQRAALDRHRLRATEHSRRVGRLVARAIVGDVPAGCWRKRVGCPASSPPARRTPARLAPAPVGISIFPATCRKPTSRGRLPGWASSRRTTSRR